MAANRHSLPSACRVPRLRRPLPRLGGHKVPATARRPLVHAPRTIQASSRFTDGGPRARDSGSGPESAPGNRLPRRRPRGITGYAPARRPARAMASTAGRGLRGGGPAAGSTGRPNRWLFQEPARPTSRASRRDRLQPSARRGHCNTALAPGPAPCAPAPPDSPWPPQRRVSPRGLLQRRPALPSGASRRDPGACTTPHGARRARPNRGAHTRARPRRRGAGKRRPTVNNTQRVSPLASVKPTPGHEQPAAAPALVTRRLTTRTNPRFRP